MSKCIMERPAVGALSRLCAVVLCVSAVSVTCADSPSRGGTTSGIAASTLAGEPPASGSGDGGSLTESGIDTAAGAVPPDVVAAGSLEALAQASPPVSERSQTAQASSDPSPVGGGAYGQSPAAVFGRFGGRPQPRMSAVQAAPSGRAYAADPALGHLDPEAARAVIDALSSAGSGLSLRARVHTDAVLEPDLLASGGAQGVIAEYAVSSAGDFSLRTAMSGSPVAPRGAYEMRRVDGDVYLRTGLPPNSLWAVASQEALALAGIACSDVCDLFGAQSHTEMMSRAVYAGADTISGVPVRMIEYDLDLMRGGGAVLVAQIWIGEHGWPWRQVFHLGEALSHFGVTGADSDAVTVTTDFFDHGTDIEIHAPPAEAF